MAVFRVERTRDYTVMSNYHLKDTGLTLKAKGLLSMMLSLPDEWNYTTRGLASICKESVETIGKTLRELESAGYLTRRQLRGKNGRITDTEYTIFEKPVKPQPEPAQQDTASPGTENPDIGDKTITEQKAFEACMDTVQELSNLLRIVVNDMQGTDIFITADHGFLYTYSPLSESDKLSRDAFIRSLVDLDPHIAHLHSGYDMPGELGTLHDRHLCKGHLLDVFQGLKHLPLPREVGGYRSPIFLAPLTCRQSAASAGLHAPAPFHQPALLIGSL